MRYGTDTAGKAFAGTNALEKDKWYSNDKFGIDALSYQEWFYHGHMLQKIRTIRSGK